MLGGTLSPSNGHYGIYQVLHQKSEAMLSLLLIQITHISVFGLQEDLDVLVLRNFEVHSYGDFEG